MPGAGASRGSLHATWPRRANAKANLDGLPDYGLHGGLVEITGKPAVLRIRAWELGELLDWTEDRQPHLTHAPAQISRRVRSVCMVSPSGHARRASSLWRRLTPPSVAEGDMQIRLFCAPTRLDRRAVVPMSASRRRACSLVRRMA